MKREEERGNAAEQYVEGFHSAIQIMCKESFVDGAKWSDEHPKEGMVDINEIGDWLIKNKDAFVTEYGFEMVRCVYHMKKAFDAYMQAKRDMTKNVIDVKL